MSIRLVGALMFAPALLWAQGSISNQGYGYPLGGLSGAAAALAGANAESDANSTLNPAAITRSNRYSILLRFEPEFRSTKTGVSGSDATVIRFPAFQATGAYGRFVGSVGVSTVLDRSWRNQYEDTLQIGDDLVSSALQTGSDGAMSDARAALGYIISPRLQVGLALHALTGENRTVFLRQFDPNSGVSTINQNSSFGFTGTAYSLGIVGEPVSDLLVSASARFGQEMSLEVGGDRLATATVPSRFGAGVSYVGIRGLSLFGRMEQTKWTDLDGLASDSTSIFDATEYSVGAEALGPRLFGSSALLRAGFRSRGLPFGVNGNAVEERGFAFGVGIPLSRGRSQIDLGAQRMRRTTPGMSEDAWHISLGFGIRP